MIDHVFERRLVVGGLTQSGGIVKGMWERALREFKIQSFGNAQDESSKFKVNNMLILGLGAGTAVEVINKKFPDAKIVGVEIDSTIIDVGKKYFQLSETKNLTVIIEDAIRYVDTFSHPEFISGSQKMLKRVQHDSREFDLILVDLYKGFLIEKEIINDTVLQNIASKLSKNGVVIFNVLAARNGDFEASDLLDKLHRIFNDNFCKRIISNDFLFCKNPITKGGDLSMAKKRKKRRK